MRRKKRFSDKVPVSILIPEALQRAIQIKANNSGRSFSAEVRQAIKTQLKIS
jgi:plasmid stability protein